MTTDPTSTRGDRPYVPPRWVVRSVWTLQRVAYRATAGRYPLRRPVRGDRFGMLRLRTVGRRTGAERAVILGYFEDDGRYVTLAMNGWADPPPAWWLNASALPDVDVDTVDGRRAVRAREAVGAERDRLWALLPEYPGWGDADLFDAHRAGRTPLVVLEPR